MARRPLLEAVIVVNTDGDVCVALMFAKERCNARLLNTGGQ